MAKVIRKIIRKENKETAEKIQNFQQSLYLYSIQFDDCMRSIKKMIE